jgi:hypothetical protein
MQPSRSLPPLECCRGTNPSQAANWRPDRNGAPSLTATPIAEAVIRSNAWDPCQPVTRRLGSVPDGNAFLNLSDLRRQGAEMVRQSLQRRPPKVGQAWVLRLADDLEQLAVFGAPCATVARTRQRGYALHLISIVRCRTSSSLTRCRVSTDCCSTLLTGANRIVGRSAASTIASASTASERPHELRRDQAPAHVQAQGSPAPSGARSPQPPSPLDRAAEPGISRAPASTLSFLYSTSRPGAAAPCTWNTCFVRSRMTIDISTTTESLQDQRPPIIALKQSTPILTTPAGKRNTWISGDLVPLRSCCGQEPPPNHAGSGAPK